MTLGVPNRSTSAITISAPVVETVGDRTIVSSAVSGPGLPDTLWFKVPTSMAGFLQTERPDWLPIALLIPAMLAGRDIDLDAPISAELAYRINTDLQHLLSNQNPRFSPINVAHRGTLGDEAFAPGPAVGTGFSGGVDTFTTLALNTADDVPPSHRITHLVVNNVGALGCGPNAAERFDAAVARATQYAAHAGFEVVPIDSNLCEFYRGDTTFEQTHTVRNLAAILVLQGLFRRYLYSSSVAYAHLNFGRAPDVSYVDPVLVPLLSTEQLAFESTGGRYSLLDRVKLLTAHPDTHDYLNICVGGGAERLSRGDGPRNCGACFKCVRHLYTLELLGELEPYQPGFNMQRYRAHPTKNLAGIYSQARFRKNPNDIDIVALARDLRHPIPLTARLRAYAGHYALRGPLRPILGRLRDRLRRD